VFLTTLPTFLVDEEYNEDLGFLLQDHLLPPIVDIILSFIPSPVQDLIWRLSEGFLFVGVGLLIIFCFSTLSETICKKEKQRASRPFRMAQDVLFSRDASLCVLGDAVYRTPSFIDQR
jgi:hypothetical protein